MFLPQRKGTMKNRFLMLLKEIIAFYPGNHIKPINTLFGQNSELLTITASGTYGYRRALNGQITM
jgi:hypothetical protein